VALATPDWRLCRTVIFKDLVFARLPSEREAARKLLSEETAPVRIFVSDSIRIEISDSCRPELMESILGFLQCHA